MEYAKPTGITYIALARENIVTHIKIKQAIVGVNFENPSDIFAKLLAAIPAKIPTAKNKYPNKGFKINLLMQSY